MYGFGLIVFHPQQVQQLPHAATSGERSGVLFDVRRLLALRQDQAAASPEDQINQGQIVALKQVRIFSSPNLQERSVTDKLVARSSNRSFSTRNSLRTK